jgi:hypothetical protein
LAPEPGEVAVSAAEWDAAGSWSPNGVAPAVAAVEAWYQFGACVGLAWRLPNGRVGVSVQSFADVPSAGAFAVGSGAGVVLAGKSILADPSLTGAVAAAGTTRQAVLDLRRYLDDGVLVHDGSPELESQVLGLRTVSSPDGPRMRSDGRADAVKVAAWAVGEARVGGDVPAIF